MHAFLPLLAAAAPLAAAQTWCGKVYMKNETVVAPGGQFVQPASSTTPLLALRCQPALVPFLPDDAGSAEIIVDALVRYSHIVGAQGVDLSSGSGGTQKMSVSASVDGKQVASGRVALNGSTALPFSLSSLTPRTEPYNLTCSGALASQSFSSQAANLTYLPDPPTGIGSVTKRDLRTGGLLAKKVGDDGGYESVLPVGFYTQFGGYLEGNDSALETTVDEGFNIIHPVPTFDNETAYWQMIDKMEELGLWLMYDMRWNYQNLSAVQAETSALHNRTNLLLYYTSDEPDGTSDPLDATTKTYDLLRSLDPYRPTSLVLNCQDYYFSEYAAGADIVLQDAYTVGNNVTFSSEWDTPCTPTQGCCGCDNCKGAFEDIRERVQTFTQRFEALGWERTKAVWTVPQGFGNAQYWKTTPTGAEWLVEAIVGLNAGARGVVSWDDPAPADIKAAAASLARAAPALAQRMLSPNASYTHVLTDNRLDFGVWSVASAGETLVLAANLGSGSANALLASVLSDATADWGNAETVLDGGAQVKDGNVFFGGTQSGAWVVRTTGNETAGAAQSSGARSLRRWAWGL